MLARRSWHRRRLSPPNEAPTPQSAAAGDGCQVAWQRRADKTRLASQLAASPALSGAGDAGGTGVGAASGVPRAQRWAAAFVKASVSDLLVRFGAARGADGGGTRGAVRFERVLLYAPPTDARAWVVRQPARQARVRGRVAAPPGARRLRRQVVRPRRAARRRHTTGARRVRRPVRRPLRRRLPGLPLSSVDASMRAALGGDGRVAAICGERRRHAARLCVCVCTMCGARADAHGVRPTQCVSQCVCVCVCGLT